MENMNQNGRRNFLKGAAMMGAASLAGTPAARAEMAQPGKPLKIGVVGVTDGSFMSWAWSDVIEGTVPGNNEPRMGAFDTSILNMDITHCWDAQPDKAQPFADRMNAKLVKNYDDMVGQVDGVIFAGIYEAPWYRQLSYPYIDAGIPVYLSRPFAHSLRDIDAILELAAKRNTPILATAKHEHYNEVPSLKAKLENLAPIDCVHATCNAHDYPMHLHTFFMLPRIFGWNVEQVGLAIDNVDRAEYLQASFLFGGGEEQRPFPCALHSQSSQDSFSITVFGRKGVERVRMERSPDWHDSLLYRYLPHIIAMQRCFEGDMFEPLENIRTKTEMWLTAYYSHLEREGAPVKMGTLSPDWVAPTSRPDWIDESIF